MRGPTTNSRGARAALRGLVLLALAAATLLAAGCASASLSLPLGPQTADGQPPPTINPLFAPREMPAAPPAPDLGGLSGQQIMRELLVEPAPAATAAPARKIVDEAVFEDQLNANWTTEHSSGVSVFADSDRPYSGNIGLKVTPQRDFGMLFFTVKPDARETYTVDRVAGVSVWINSGDQPLDPNDLSITVVGSNDYTYWRPDDNSVATDSTHFFSESRLYYLGVRNTVPPHTWVEAVVWLDQLPYDPDYKYVTGVYIKNDEWFRRTFYVDQVHLLVVQ